MWGEHYILTKNHKPRFSYACLSAICGKEAAKNSSQNLKIGLRKKKLHFFSWNSNDILAQLFLLYMVFAEVVKPIFAFLFPSSFIFRLNRSCLNCYWSWTTCWNFSSYSTLYNYWIFFLQYLYPIYFFYA